MGTARPANCIGSGPGKRCSIGRSRSPSGSSAARPTPRTTASTGTWTRPLADKPAIVWEGEPGDSRQLTYAELHREVCKFANVLKSLGIETGDVVSIYMPMVPELAIAMLACARIGAVHSVIFGGFSSEAIADRNNDAQAKLQITADYGWRRGQQLPLKQNVDEALAKSPSVQEMRRAPPHRRAGRHASRPRSSGGTKLMATASADCPAEPLDSETPLFILYTSGSTGKPKGIRHTTAGYNLFAKKTFEWVFDHRDRRRLLVYGRLRLGHRPQLCRVRPAVGRRHGGDVRGSAELRRTKAGSGRSSRNTKSRSSTPRRPRSARSSNGATIGSTQHDLSSLRLLGTVGEGINPEAWMWYHRKIGGGRCPIVDTWWQTETGGIMMSPLPGAIATKPGSCTKPLPGIVPAIVDSHGKPVPQGQGGWLVITKPWPGMLRGIWGDDDRYREQYWSKVPHMYLAGDNARQDADGYYWIMGRIDDVLNVAGHRLSTIEIESAAGQPSAGGRGGGGRPARRNQGRGGGGLRHAQSGRAERRACARS